MGAMSVSLMLVQNCRLWRILVVIGCSALADMVALATEHLFVADMHPLDLALSSQRIGQPIQTVADDAMDPLDAGRREGLGELIRNGLHDLAPSCGRRIRGMALSTKCYEWST